MHSYRITKYNPQYRNQFGFYTQDEWTSISDIGTIYKNKKLTFEDYCQVESSYNKAVITIMDFCDVDFLYINQLEKNTVNPLNNFYFSNPLPKIYANLHEGQKIYKEEIKQVMQLVLREFLWCKLENENMFVHFGWDYYMYIGSSIELSKLVIEQIEKSGLYVEEFYSPYLE